MLTMKQLLGTNSIDDVPLEHQWNMEDLIVRVNKLLAHYKGPVVVTSGWRSMQRHKDIYRAKGIADSKIPMKSRHLYGNAVDIADASGDFNKWLLSAEGQKALDEADLWCEERQGGWQHLQREPFGSYKPGGTRWFKP